MASSFLKSPLVQEIAGRSLAGYLKLVRRLARFTYDPKDIHERIRPELPLIFAMWHGQHIMIPFARPDWMPACSLASRHGDGEINAIALRQLGIGAIRGSGALGRKVREKGGAGAFLAMVKRLSGGETMVLTADIPKRARVCGPGIVQLAKISGRPVLPVAVVMRWRWDFSSWDRASIGLPVPFNRGAIVVGEPVFVARDASDAETEAARITIERSLDEVHERAYAMIGQRDPGGELGPRNRAGIASRQGGKPDRPTADATA